MIDSTNFQQQKKHNSPQFGRDALFERHLPFAKKKLAKAREPLERLKSRGASVEELVDTISERAYADHYESTRRMANTKEDLPHILRAANREARLRANIERNAKLDRTTVKPFTVNLEMPDAKNGFVLNKKSLPSPPEAEAEIRQQKCQTVIAKYIKPGLAKLAQGTESPSENWPALRQLEKGRKLLGQLGYLGKRNKSMDPVVIHAQANLGTATFDHQVRKANLMTSSVCVPCNDKTFEGMVVRFPYREDPKFRKNKPTYIQKMEQELGDLKKAIDNTRSTITPANARSFILAGLYNRQAEVEHALAHYQFNDKPEFEQHSQNARKAVRAANEAYQEIPMGQRTEEHARLSYNLNTKANHLCDKHDQHSPASEKARELCQTTKVEDMPANIFTMKRLPGFDPTYGKETEFERLKIFD